MNTKPIYLEHNQDAAHSWDFDKWSSFSARELACNHCGEAYVWPDFLDRLQWVRDKVGKPIVVLSGHRCALHNARVGGAPLSQHLKLAVDIRLLGHDPQVLLAACREAGFTGFGFYQTFLHIDLGPPRRWFGSHTARVKWQVYLD